MKDGWDFWGGFNQINLCLGMALTKWGVVDIMFFPKFIPQPCHRTVKSQEMIRSCDSVAKHVRYLSLWPERGTGWSRQDLLCHW